MKKKTALIGVCTIAASTIGLTFIQPTIIHQLVIWVAGVFSMLVALAVFAIGNWQQSERKPLAPAYDRWVCRMVEHGRANGYSDQKIALDHGIDIDVIKAIPR